jgi:hypothetical protein
MRHNAVGLWWWGRSGKGAALGAGSSSQRVRGRRLRPTLLALEERRLPSAFLPLTEPNYYTRTVINTHNSGEGSPRWAIDQANHDARIILIDFSPSFDNSPQTITLESADLAINSPNLVIRGPNNGVTVNADGRSRVFTVGEGATAEIDNFTMTRGSIVDYGGGVYNRGDLRLEHCTVVDNTSFGTGVNNYGGGVYNVGTLHLEDCTVTDNQVNGKEYFAPSFGGGIANYGGTVYLDNSTISYNQAKVGGSGGGLYNYGTAYVTNCTFVGNSAYYGGGLYNDSDATLVSSTFTLNHATKGGGLYANQTLDIWDTIIAGNTAPRAGGDVKGHVHSGGNFNPKGGHNLVGNTSDSSGWYSPEQGGTDLTDEKNPGLLPLGFNGGWTETVALSLTSAAIHKGTKVKDAAGYYEVTRDQRGLRLDTPPDIGAFQVQRGELASRR